MQTKSNHQNYVNDWAEMARERLDAIAQNREAIIEAFIAKYGVGPEQIVQKIHQDGSVECWKVELTEEGKKALESREGRALALLRRVVEAHPYILHNIHWQQLANELNAFLAAQPDPEPTDDRTAGEGGE